MIHTQVPPVPTLFTSTLLDCPFEDDGNAEIAKAAGKSVDEIADDEWQECDFVEVLGVQVIPIKDDAVGVPVIVADNGDVYRGTIPKKLIHSNTAVFTLWMLCGSGHRYNVHFQSFVGEDLEKDGIPRTHIVTERLPDYQDFKE